MAIEDINRRDAEIGSELRRAYYAARVPEQMRECEKLKMTDMVNSCKSMVMTRFWESADGIHIRVQMSRLRRMEE